IIESRKHLRAVATLARDNKLRKRGKKLAHSAARGGLVVGNQSFPLSLFHRLAPDAFRDKAVAALRLYRLPDVERSRVTLFHREEHADARVCSRCRDPAAPALPDRYSRHR